jgi:hypothetical protein
MSNDLRTGFVRLKGPKRKPPIVLTFASSDKPSRCTWPLKYVVPLMTQLCHDTLSLWRGGNASLLWGPRQGTSAARPCSGMGGWGMKGVDTIARVRREYFVRGKTIKEIVRDRHLSRNTGAQDPAVRRDRVHVRADGAAAAETGTMARGAGTPAGNECGAAEPGTANL